MTYAELFDLYSKSQEQKEKAFDYILKESLETQRISSI